MDKWGFPHVLGAHACTQHASSHTSADMHSNTFTSNLSMRESTLIMVTSKWTNEVSHASLAHMRAPSTHLWTPVLICTPIHSQVILARVSQTWLWSLQNEQMSFPTRPGRTRMHAASIFTHKCWYMHSQVISAHTSQTWLWSLHNKQTSLPTHPGCTCTHFVSILMHTCVLCIYLDPQVIICTPIH
jgi:hypothetical protein